MMDLFQAISPHVAPDDPLLAALGIRSGMAAPAAQEWRTGSASEASGAADSALSRNKQLLPIVRGTGKKIPLYRIT
jgi:hypothetical protein